MNQAFQKTAIALFILSSTFTYGMNSDAVRAAASATSLREQTITSQSKIKSYDAHFEAFGLKCIFYPLLAHDLKAASVAEFKARIEPFVSLFFDDISQLNNASFIQLSEITERFAWIITHWRSLAEKFSHGPVNRELLINEYNKRNSFSMVAKDPTGDTSFSCTLAREVEKSVPYLQALMRVKAQASTDPYAIIIPCRHPHTVLLMRELLYAIYFDYLLRLHQFDYQSAMIVRNCSAAYAVASVLSYYSSKLTIDVNDLLSIAIEWDMDSLLDGILLFAEQTLSQEELSLFANTLPYPYCKKIAASCSSLFFILKCLWIKISSQQNQDDNDIETCLQILAKRMQPLCFSNSAGQFMNPGQFIKLFPQANIEKLERYRKTFLRLLDQYNIQSSVVRCIPGFAAGTAQASQGCINRLLTRCKELSKTNELHFQVRGYSDSDSQITMLNTSNSAIKMFDINCDGVESIEDYDTLDDGRGVILAVSNCDQAYWCDIYSSSQDPQYAFSLKNSVKNIPCAFCALNNSLLFATVHGISQYDLAGNHIKSIEDYCPTLLSRRMSELERKYLNQERFSSEERTEYSALENQLKNNLVKTLQVSCGNILAQYHDGTIKIFDANSFQQRACFSLPECMKQDKESIPVIASCLDKDHLILGYNDGKCIIFDVESTKPLLRLMHPLNKITPCCITPLNVRTIAIAYTCGCICFFNRESGIIEKALFGIFWGKPVYMRFFNGILKIMWSKGTYEEYVLPEYA